MGFDESALTRLRRYREEANRSLALIQESEAAASRLSERLFAGLEYSAVLAREAGFEMETEGGAGTFTLRATAAPGAEARLAFGLAGGAAAETDEDLMHEELSHYNLDPSGYSGRILGWTEAAGEEPGQTFAVYRDGVWKTKGLFVAKARGKADDPDDVMNGFCLRILGRLIDLAAMTGGAGRRWSNEPYSLKDHLSGSAFPTEPRFPR
ncbi:MAG: hypothetical protein H0V83_15065 [Rubrobacter sp.]|nr:hypothetical protein [Rubrobacter sp.]